MTITKNDKLKSMFGLSEHYINGLSEKEKSLYFLVRPVRSSKYHIDVRLTQVENHINSLIDDAKILGGELQLNPDFQRGHVWDEQKQIAFMENVLRKSAPVELKFNCAKFFESNKQINPNMNGGDIVCIDGLQRLTAIREFVADKFKVFGRYNASDLKQTPFDIGRYTFKFEMFDFDDKRDLLQFYIDLNSGGVVHSKEEIERVKSILEYLEWI